jgi:signal transduction histidine kinase/DNA-binding response OmpR family regulator
MPSSAPLFTAAQERPRRDWFLRFGPYGSALLGLSAVLLIWFGAAYFIYAEKQQTEHAAREDAANLARAFAEDIVRSIRAVDQTLLYVRDSYIRDPQHFDVSLWSRNSQFLGEFNFQVSIVDRNGTLIASNIPGSVPGLELGDREHFQIHAGRDTDELFISKPLIGRLSHKLSIQFTRRITMPDGSFGGVAVVSVDPEYLSQLYRSIDVGQNGVVALVGTDGVVRARGARGPSDVGASVAANGSLLKAYARSKDGFYTRKSPLDGIERIYAYRGVPDYPLIVTVGLAVDEVFAIYYQNRRTTIAIAAVLTLWLLAVTYLIFRYQRILAKARDAAEAGTRARSEFLAMMSHELRTPMNGVVGMADILLDTRLDDEQGLCVRTLRASASHLLQVINDVLDFSKLEAGRIEIEKIRFDVHALLRDTAALMTAPAREKNLQLLVDIAPDVPRYTIGDPARLRQVLFNLVSNGLKFTKAGHVAIGVALAPEQFLGKIRLAFTVADTGMGIPQDGIPLLFRRFSQLDSSIARRFGGTGLGLAICKRLVDLMGGTISVESTVGAGTTFRFTVDCLPAEAPADAGELQQSPPLVPAASAAARPLRLLLVEDNKTNQLVAIKMLRGLGYTVDIAGNGFEAIAACGATGYDIVFMDVMMPEMDGLAATRAIRKLPPPNCDPHIIALTAAVQKEDKDLCLDAGMNDFLIKPVTKSAIAEKLAAFFVAAPAGTPVAPAPAPVPETQHAAGDAERYDPAIYAELAEALGPGGVGEVLELFLSDTERRFLVMREAAKDDDSERVKRETHSLKSSAANFGFLRLSAMAHALEQDAFGLNWPELLARLEAVAREFAAVKTFAAAHHVPFATPDHPEHGEHAHAG